MNKKQLIIILAIATVSITVVLLSVILIYKFDPTILGYPPLPVEIVYADTVAAEKTIEITESKLKKFEKSLIEKNKFKKDRDSLISLKHKLIDSMTSIQEVYNTFRDSISSVKKTLSDSVKIANNLRDSLQKLESNYKKALDKIDLANKQIENQEKFIIKKTDSNELKNFQIFAKMYDNSSPQDIAKILEQIDERDAALILKLMKKKKAGKVIDEMLPERAAAILLLGY